jgi:hypothetical protein
MKTLKEYLAESVKEYSYKVKILGEVEDGMMDTIENELKRYDLKTISSPTKTIFQKQPLDFDEGVSGEVNIASFTTGLPLSKDTVRDRIAHQLGITERYIKIRSENDPLEYDLVDNNVDTEIVVGESNPEDAALNNDYPADEHKAEDYHGNEFNTKFMNELMKLVKDRDTHVSNYMKEE